MSKLTNLKGLTINNIYIIDFSKNKKNGKTHYICKCYCGKQFETLGASLKNGRTKSCGCLKKMKATKHGKNKTRLYRIYHNILQRCNKENNKDYKNYGGRGIKICDEWFNKENGFINFYNWSMENGYKEELTIDRINNNGNYEPSNCRWVTRKTQNNNRRDNIFLKIKGEYLNGLEILEKYNIDIKEPKYSARIYRKGIENGEEILGIN